MQDVGRQFSVGEVIQTSVSILGRNIVPFGGLALIFHLPLLLLGGAAIGSVAMGFGAGAVIGLVVGFVLTFAVYGALVFGTTEDLRGRPVALSDCLSRGFATLLPVLGVAILVGLGVAVGMMLLVVPGLILFVMWWVAVPVAVIERPGITAALGRSAALTKGCRWQVAGIVAVLWLAGVILSSVVGFIFGGGVIGTVLGVILQALLAAMGAVLATVSYYRLRADKEGVQLADVARVFD